MQAQKFYHKLFTRCNPTSGIHWQKAHLAKIILCPRKSPWGAWRYSGNRPQRFFLLYRHTYIRLYL